MLRISFKNIARSKYTLPHKCSTPPNCLSIEFVFVHQPTVQNDSFNVMSVKINMIIIVHMHLIQFSLAH